MYGYDGLDDRDPYAEAEAEYYAEQEYWAERETAIAEAEAEAVAAEAEWEADRAYEEWRQRQERIVYVLDQATCPTCGATAIGQMDVVPCLAEFSGVSPDGEVEGWTGQTVLEWDSQAETGAFMRREADRLDAQQEPDNASNLRGLYPDSTVRVTCGAHEWESLITAAN